MCLLSGMRRCMIAFVVVLGDIYSYSLVRIGVQEV